MRGSRLCTVDRDFIQCGLGFWIGIVFHATTPSVLRGVACALCAEVTCALAEDQWLPCCRRRREAGPQLDEPNDIAERQPMFLKDKGDALFSKGNYQAARELPAMPSHVASHVATLAVELLAPCRPRPAALCRGRRTDCGICAVNAYTRAVELDGRIAVCFANRSACHLKLGMHKHCLMDCDRALELLSNAGEPAAEADGAQAADAGESEGGKAAPEGAGPREGDPEGRAEAKARRMRVKVLCRRAKAKAALGDAAGALADLRAAGGLDPADESIQKSIEDAVLAQGAMVSRGMRLCHAEDDSPRQQREVMR